MVALALVIWLAVGLLHRGGNDGGENNAQAAKSTSAPTDAAAASSPVSAANPSSQNPSTTTGAAPAAQVPCPDQSLAVKVAVAQPTYKAGEQPVFNIVITNISSTACERDTGAALQQVSVQSLDGQRRLWASTDCNPEGTPDPRTLSPGQQAFFTVTWSGTTSQPNCAGDRIPVPSGAYTVVAQLGSVRSAPEPFNIA